MFGSDILDVAIGMVLVFLTIMSWLMLQTFSSKVGKRISKRNGRQLACCQ